MAITVKKGLKSIKIMFCLPVLCSLQYHWRACFQIQWNNNGWTLAQRSNGEQWSISPMITTDTSTLETYTIASNRNIQTPHPSMHYSNDSQSTVKSIKPQTAHNYTKNVIISHDSYINCVFQHSQGLWKSNGCIFAYLVKAAVFFLEGLKGRERKVISDFHFTDYWTVNKRMK